MGHPVVENAVTGERGILRRAPESDAAPLIADLYARPRAAVVGEHLHPGSTEAFTVVRGTLGVRLDGVESRLEAGTRVVIPPGTRTTGNDGDETAGVVVEVDPGHRFQAMISNLFGLAADGRTDARGRPSLPQAALLAREFDDTVRSSSPPRFVRRPLVAALAPVARLRGLRGSYPHVRPREERQAELEDLPLEIAALVPTFRPPRRPAGFTERRAAARPYPPATDADP